jgi:hypothetical protein
MSTRRTPRPTTDIPLTDSMKYADLYSNFLRYHSLVSTTTLAVIPCFCFKNINEISTVADLREHALNS